MLVQSVILALLVLGLPLLRYRRGTHPKAKSIVKSILYFAGLGLGFLFMEIWLIDKAAWFLSDRTYAFAIVLTVMLVSSGIGSALAGRFTDNPRQGLTYACVGIFTWVIVMAMILDPLLQALLGWPLPLKVAVLVVLSAPLGRGAGFPVSARPHPVPGQEQSLPALGLEPERIVFGGGDAAGQLARGFGGL